MPRCTNLRLWYTLSCTGSPRAICGKNVQGIRCKLPPWFTKPTSRSGSSTKWNGRIGLISLGWPHAQCARSWWTTPAGMALKSGAEEMQVLPAGAALVSEPDLNVLALDQALERFSRDYPRQARVVELRFFGGLTTEETGEVLNRLSQ